MSGYETPIVLPRELFEELIAATHRVEELEAAACEGVEAAPALPGSEGIAEARVALSEVEARCAAYRAVVRGRG